MKFRQYGWILLGFYLVHCLAVFKMAAVNGEASGDTTHTYCTTNWRPNERGTVTCHFSEDVSQTRRNFKVQRRDFDEDWKANADTILACVWLEKADNFTCDSEEGWDVEGSISSVVIIGIHRVIKSFAGEYVCHLVGGDQPQSQTCNITIAGTQDDHEINLPLILGIGIPVFILVVVVIIVCCVWHRHRGTRARGKGERPAPTNHPEEIPPGVVKSRREEFEQLQDSASQSTGSQHHCCSCM